MIHGEVVVMLDDDCRLHLCNIVVIIVVVMLCDVVGCCVIMGVVLWEVIGALIDIRFD